MRTVGFRIAHDRPACHRRAGQTSLPAGRQAQASEDDKNLAAGQAGYKC
ncbi:MAG: hypothetical protein ACHQET_03930 [Chitinophagales bacterium]